MISGYRWPGDRAAVWNFPSLCVTEQDLSEHSVTLSDFDALWVLEEEPYLGTAKRDRSFVSDPGISER